MRGDSTDERKTRELSMLFSGKNASSLGATTDDEQANKGEMDGSGRERTDLVCLVPTCDSVSTDRRMDAIRSSS